MSVALDNITSTSAPPSQSVVHAARFQWDLLATAKYHSSPGARVRRCATFTVGEDNNARVIRTPKGPRIQGLNGCGAHHVCPRCAVTYRGEWTAKVKWLMSYNGKLGRRAYFFTGTVPHHAQDAAGPMIEALSAAWNASFSGRSRRQLRRLGFAGYAKALDYTVGGAGHHLHLHAILWFDEELAAEDLATLNAGLFGRWSRSVSRSLGRECTREAFYIEPVDDELATADYVAKMCGVPLELTSALTKAGKGRTIWGVLRDMTLAAGDVDLVDVAIWRQYSDAIKGRRGIELSREMHALMKDRVAEEREEPEVILTVPRSVYRVIRSESLQPLLVELVESRAGPWLTECQEAFDAAATMTGHELRELVLFALG